MNRAASALAVLREWTLRFWGALRGRRADHDIRQELAAHLELAEEQLRRQGCSPEEAARLARVRSGNSTAAMETLREQRGVPFLSTLWLDIKLGRRMLRKHWGLTLVGGLAMVVSITIGATVYDFLHAIAGTDVPLEAGGRMVVIQPWEPESRKEQYSPVEEFERWRDGLQSVEDVGAFYTVERNLVTSTGQSAPVVAAAMSPAGFRVARVSPLLGRTLLEEDEAFDAAPAVVIGYDTWQASFFEDPAAIGQQIQLDGALFTVVGVMPEGFLFPVNHGAWIPLRTNPLGSQRLADNAVGGNPGGPPGLIVFARLKDGVEMSRAQAEVEALGLVTRTETPRSLQPRLVPYTIGITGNTDAWLVRLLGYGLALLLIPPCANIAILIYARTVSRQGEFVTRSALGASRGRIVGQVFIEALVLSTGAAAVALFLAREIVGALHAGIQDRLFGSFPFWIDFGLSYWTVLYVAGLAVFAAVISGAVPALQATGRWRFTGIHTLAARSTPRLGKLWTALVVMQVALSVAVLPTAVRFTWWNLRTAVLGPGFDADQYLTAQLTLAESGAPPSAGRFAQLRAELVRQLEAEPGVAAVSVAQAVPTEAPFFRVEVEAGSPTKQGLVGPLRPPVAVNQVDAAFFPTLNRRMLAGRPFEAADLEPGRRTVVVNRSFAEVILGEGNVLGSRVRFRTPGDSPEPWWEVVGVVADLNSNGAGSELYRPLPPVAPVPWLSRAGVSQARLQPMSLIVRTRPDSRAQVAARLRELTAALDPALRAGQVRTMRQIHEEHILGDIVGGSALAGTILVILGLSLAGVYTLMAFTVTQRRREIGIRAALGAPPGRLVAGIFRSVFLPVGAGALLGGLIALFLEYFQWVIVAALMDGREARWMLPAAEGLLFLAALSAIAGPVRRALRIDPVEALRDA